MLILLIIILYLTMYSEDQYHCAKIYNQTLQMENMIMMMMMTIFLSTRTYVEEAVLDTHIDALMYLIFICDHKTDNLFMVIVLIINEENL